MKTSVIEVHASASRGDAPKHKSPSATAPPSSIADAPKSSAVAPLSAAPKSAPVEAAIPSGGAISSAEAEKYKATPNKH